MIMYLWQEKKPDFQLDRHSSLQKKKYAALYLLIHKPFLSGSHPSVHKPVSFPEQTTKADYVRQ